MLEFQASHLSSRSQLEIRVKKKGPPFPSWEAFKEVSYTFLFISLCLETSFMVTYRQCMIGIEIF